MLPTSWPCIQRSRVRFLVEPPDSRSNFFLIKRFRGRPRFKFSVHNANGVDRKKTLLDHTIPTSTLYYTKNTSTTPIILKTNNSTFNYYFCWAISLQMYNLRSSVPLIFIRARCQIFFERIDKRFTFKYLRMIELYFATISLSLHRNTQLTFGA